MKPVRNSKSHSNAWFVYILRCGDDSLYTGITNDLSRRLEAHGNGKASRYTSSRLPVKLVYVESAGNRSAALRREFSIKQMGRRRKEKLIEAGRPDEQRSLHVHNRRRAPAAAAQTSGRRA